MNHRKYLSTQKKPVSFFFYFFRKNTVCFHITNMKLEIQSASNFITHLIRLKHQKKVSEGKLFKFRQYLINGMKMRYRDHWFPEKPQKGCGYRTIRCNDKLDPLIAQAGEVCGLSEDLFEKKTFPMFILWINPKDVSYRFGEYGSIYTLYEHTDLQPWNTNFLLKKKPNKFIFYKFKN